ncbi:MAG: sigma-70 factor domain-containing protein [Thermodesulfobacteriota bacterium]
MKEWVPKRSYRSEQSEDALIISDELGLNVVSEFPGLKVENENVLLRKEEEVVEYHLESFGKAADLVGFYLKEMGSFRLLSREGEVEIAKRIESGQQEMRKEATLEEIAERMGMSPGKMQKIYKIAKRPILLETPVKEFHRVLKEF